MADLGRILAAVGSGVGDYTQRSRRRRMEDEEVAERKEDRRIAGEDRARANQRADTSLEVALRGGGYVPESETAGDTSVPGQTLDAILSAATGKHTGGGLAGAPTRYGSGPEGWRYDRMNPKAVDANLDQRLKRANISRLEREPEPRPERNIDPLSGEGINAAAERAKAISRAVPRTQPAPKPASPEDEATAAIQAAGGDVAKAELGLANDPGSQWRRLTPAARARTLRAAADRYQREGRNDAARNAMGQLISGGAASRAAPPPAPQQFDDASITNEEIVEAMANGAETEEDVRAYVMKKRGGG